MVQLRVSNINIKLDGFKSLGGLVNVAHSACAGAKQTDDPFLEYYKFFFLIGATLATIHSSINFWTKETVTNFAMSVVSSP